MFEWMAAHQLNIMLSFSSVCFVVGFFALLTKSLPWKRKMSLAALEFFASILLYSDRLAYIYHGMSGYKGFWMVRISNFLVFFMTISVVYAFNFYLTDLCRNEIGLAGKPKRLRLVDFICLIGWGLVIVTQFTGLYYTFDANNAYQRGPGFMICYVIPFLALFLQLSLIFEFYGRMSRNISVPLILFTAFPMVASLVQAKYYGFSFTNIAIVGMGIVLYVFAIMEMNEKLEAAQQQELQEAKNKNLSIRRSFEQTVKMIVNTLDEKDKYTRGHSIRVAEYAREIAKNLGLDERECFRIYYAAALHNIGRLRLTDTLIGKKGHLSAAEEKELEKIPELGQEILANVKELPYLQTAAASYRERYDGKGYPQGLKGEEIPLMARITAVANAYDEMTSFTAERRPMAQGRVRQKLLEGAGREFDPKIVEVMISMIDKDNEYMMREPEDENVEESDRNDIMIMKQMHFDGYKEKVSDGIRITGNCLHISFEVQADAGGDPQKSLPAILLFDSFDCCVHRNERNIRNLHYMEFAEIWMNGHEVSTAARAIQKEITKKDGEQAAETNGYYEICAVNYKDHVKITIDSPEQTIDMTVALPDATRYVYLGLTGEHCTIRNIAVSEEATEADANTISRIAPEVSYFTRRDGDVPNVEVDGYREASTAGIPVEEGLRLLFSTQSLPEARLVLHCAYIVLFTSEDGLVNGKNYKEYACIRMDGDDATNEGCAKNALIVQKTADFDGWDDWKEKNRRGLDYEVQFRRKKNRISFETEKAGIVIECTTTVPEGNETVYVALYGNLCTLMNIRVRF